MQENGNIENIDKEQTPAGQPELTASVDAARNKDKRKKLRNKILGYVLFLGISAAVILVMTLLEDRSGDPMSGAEALGLLAEHPFYTACAALSYLVMILLDVIVYRALTIKMKPTCSVSACLKVSLLGRYFDRVTPWAIGGEPFQIFYFHKSGLETSDSCAVTMSRHIIRFFSVAIAVIAILLSFRIVANIYVMIAAILSVIGGLIIPSFMLICAFKPIIGKKISDGIIAVLCKLHIIKNREKASDKIYKKVEKFLTGIRYLSANKGVIAVIAVCSVAELFINNSVPFFVMKALGAPNVEYWKTLVLCLYVNYASSFAPTPGGAGIAELSFYAIFDYYIGGGLLFWAVLFWRIAIFYIPVAIGFVTQAVDSVGEIIKIKKSL